MGLLDKLFGKKEEKAVELPNFQEEIWIKELWDWADRNSIPDLYWNETEKEYVGLPRNKNKLLELEKLYISSKIFEIPGEIGKLINLTSITLYLDNIIVLPEEIVNLVNLRELYYSVMFHNIEYYSDYPATFAYVPHAADIYFNNTKIDKTLVSLIFLFNNQEEASKVWEEFSKKTDGNSLSGFSSVEQYNRVQIAKNPYNDSNTSRYSELLEIAINLTNHPFRLIIEYKDRTQVVLDDIEKMKNSFSNTPIQTISAISEKQDKVVDTLAFWVKDKKEATKIWYILDDICWDNISGLSQIEIYGVIRVENNSYTEIVDFMQVLKIVLKNSSSDFELWVTYEDKDCKKTNNRVDMIALVN